MESHARGYRLVVLAVIWCFGCAGPAPDKEGAMRLKVLLIGIDGVRPDVLAEVSTPALDALAEQGVFWGNARTVLPTISGPAWSSMLTGVEPQKHRVFGNDFEGHRYSDFPDFLTRVERADPNLRTAAFGDWLPLLTEDSGGPTIGPEVDLRFSVDGYEVGWAEGDEQVVVAAVEELSQGDPDAVFVYLGTPDEVSHQTTSIGTEYRAALEAADVRVARLISAVRARDGEDWLILVSTDHGRLPDGDHGGESEVERTIFVLLQGSSVASAGIGTVPSIADLAVTALDHMGVAIDPAWQLDGRSLLR